MFVLSLSNKIVGKMSIYKKGIRGTCKTSEKHVLVFYCVRVIKQHYTIPSIVNVQCSKAHHSQRTRSCLPWNAPLRFWIPWWATLCPRILSRYTPEEQRPTTQETGDTSQSDWYCRFTLHLPIIDKVQLYGNIKTTSIFKYLGIYLISLHS